jgi:predicted house-cleaning NTP pyrophosphatase (Maf/HAM1 superfamily)
MLVRLSEKMHYVFTAVSVLERRWNFSFIERTAVNSARYRPR